MNQLFRKIVPTEIKDNFIQLIGKEWMLVTAGTAEKFNTMTASWGGAGELWGKPVVFVFIRPGRYTREFMEQRGEFTLSFMGEAHKEVHKVCGSRSGREIDKVAATGLTPWFTEKGNPMFEEARLALECKTLYVSQIEEGKFLDPAICPRWYTADKGGFHYLYVAEITGAWEQ
ncbi:MAG: flavin reductase family protein [Parabacteroides sp.]